MAVDRKSANLKMLTKAHGTQDKTKEVLIRILRQTNEAEEIGSQSLVELKRQGHQIVCTVVTVTVTVTVSVSLSVV